MNLCQICFTNLCQICFKIGDYVMSFMNRQEGSYLAQLRCDILHLHIEMGWWYGVKEEVDRICEACNNNQIENGDHFIFQAKHTHHKEPLCITTFVVWCLHL